MNAHLLVELVSPLILGGSDPRECDRPPTLRPPSVRGQLRFWARALGGPGLDDELFGNVDNGQRVRVLHTLAQRRQLRSPELAPPGRARIAPSVRQPFSMIPPGDRVVIHFGLPPGLEESPAFLKLQASVWTWLHLGAVGRRSRRGYGSLQWVPTEDSLLADWPKPWPSAVASSTKLAEFLNEGLTKVSKIFPSLDSNGRRPGDGDRLLAFDQVFVSEKRHSGPWRVREEPAGGGQLGRLERAVHGLNRENDLSGADGDLRNELGQLGWAPIGRHGLKRLSSPMMWRCFKTPADRYIPVMTWFPHKYGESPPVTTRGTSVDSYLRDTLGFSTSLAGRDLAG